MEHFQIKWGQAYLFGGHNYLGTGSMHLQKISRDKSPLSPGHLSAGPEFN